MFLIYSHYQKSAYVEPMLRWIKSRLSVTEDEARADISGMLVLGGDGTLLRVLARFRDRTPLVYSFNYGSYGFLTPFKEDQVKDVVGKITEGFAFNVVRRRRLQVSDIGNALNDVLITRRSHGRLNEFEISINGLSAGRVKCDGVLVSTASGSSGYNYSAGGPLLAGSSNAFVVNCLNPCRTYFRPIVLSESARISIQVLESQHDRSEALCVLDGHHEVLGRSRIDIAVSETPVYFASLLSEDAMLVEDIARIQNLN